MFNKMSLELIGYTVKLVDLRDNTEGEDFIVVLHKTQSQNIDEIKSKYASLGYEAKSISTDGGYSKFVDINLLDLYKG